MGVGEGGAVFAAQERAGVAVVGVHPPSIGHIPASAAVGCGGHEFGGGFAGHTGCRPSTAYAHSGLATGLCIPETVADCAGAISGKAAKPIAGTGHAAASQSFVNHSALIVAYQSTEIRAGSA